MLRASRFLPAVRATARRCFGSSSGSSSAKPFSAPPSVDELKKSAQRATGPDALPNQGYVPDVDGLVGRARREAVYKRVYGEDLHDVEPKQYMEEGTRENPIPILSTESERLVGVSLPDDAEIRWMILRKNEVAYDPDTNNFFALKHVTPAEVDAWVARAEEVAFGKK